MNGAQEKSGMIFAELKPIREDGSKWTTKDQDELAGKWSAVRLHIIYSFFIV